MSYMKYIHLKNGATIIFSESITHKQMAEHFGGKDEVDSAGQVAMSIDENEISARGESLTLGLSSSPEDRGRIYRSISMYA